MKTTILNVLRVGAGGLLVASFLTACADGRGNNGFKSYQFSQDEMAVNKAKRDAKLAAQNPSNIPVGGATAAEVGGETGGGRAALPARDAVTGDATKQAEQTAALNPLAVDTSEYEGVKDEAKAKKLTEFGQEAVETSVASLLVTNSDVVTKANNKVIPELAKLVKGMTVKSTRSEKEVLLNLQALVSLDGKDYGVYVQNAPIVFKKDGKTENVQFKLVSLKDNKAYSPGRRLFVFAVCMEETCSNVQIKLSFELSGGRRLAAIAIYRLIDGGATLQGSNFGDIAEFAKGQDDGQKVTNPLDKNAKPATAEEAAAAKKLAESVAEAKAIEDARVKAEQEKAAADKAEADKAQLEKSVEKVDAAKASVGAAAEAIGVPSEQVSMEALKKEASEEAAIWAAGGALGTTTTAEPAKALEDQGNVQTTDGAALQGTTDPDQSTNVYKNVDDNGSSTQF